MAIGQHRHYGVDGIAPRHFLQTAKLCNVPQSTVKAIFDELRDTAPKAIETSIAGLPHGFPEALVQSITSGVMARFDISGCIMKRRIHPHALRGGARDL